MCVGLRGVGFARLLWAYWVCVDVCAGVWEVVGWGVVMALLGWGSTVSGC